MESLSTHALFLLSLIAAALLVQIAAYPFCRTHPQRKAKLDAGFEVFFGFFLICMFAYPTVRGLVEGVAWFSARNSSPVQIAKAIHPTFYWVIEGFGGFISLFGFAIMRSGIHNFRKPSANES